jgi:hypothetical protein
MVRDCIKYEAVVGKSTTANYKRFGLEPLSLSLRRQKSHMNYPGHSLPSRLRISHRSADKSLARPGRKQATAREYFDIHISYL